MKGEMKKEKKRRRKYY